MSKFQEGFNRVMAAGRVKVAYGYGEAFEDMWTDPFGVKTLKTYGDLPAGKAVGTYAKGIGTTLGGLGAGGLLGAMLTGGRAGGAQLGALLGGGAGAVKGRQMLGEAWEDENPISAMASRLPGLGHSGLANPMRRGGMI